MIGVSISLYNQGQYLHDAVDSLLTQTKKPDKIIIVNDGSTDDSLKVAKKFKVKIIEQVNKGLSSARNTGLMNLTSEYVLFLDADDYLAENCIERMEQVIKETGADIVAPSMQCFGTSSQEVILMPNPTLDDFKTANRIPYCSAIKREKLLEVGGYSPKMTYGYEDYHLWFNLISRGAKVVTIPEPLFFYRTKEQSMWHDAVRYHGVLMGQIMKDFPFVTEIISNPLPK